MLPTWNFPREKVMTISDELGQAWPPPELIERFLLRWQQGQVLSNAAHTLIVSFGLPYINLL